MCTNCLSASLRSEWRSPFRRHPGHKLAAVALSPRRGRGQTLIRWAIAILGTTHPQHLTQDASLFWRNLHVVFVATLPAVGAGAMVGEGPVVGISGAGEEEHAEGIAALLAVLELVGTDTQAFEDAVEELARVVNHHLTEEELTILNPARDDVSDGIRGELGEAFSVERNRQIDAGCGHIENVKKLVNAAKKDGLLEKN